MPTGHVQSLSVVFKVFVQSIVGACLAGCASNVIEVRIGGAALAIEVSNVAAPRED